MLSHRDIKGYFDHVSHEWMLKFLQVRINDPSLLLLIRRFLKAGYLEADQLVSADRGTPQGGNLSPMLANVFLHYVLDLWFAKVVAPRVQGACQLVAGLRAVAWLYRFGQGKRGLFQTHRSVHCCVGPATGDRDERPVGFVPDAISVMAHDSDN